MLRHAARVTGVRSFILVLHFSSHRIADCRVMRIEVSTYLLLFSSFPFHFPLSHSNRVCHKLQSLNTISRFIPKCLLSREKTVKEDRGITDQILK
jgi:hypothetical protein